jgi:ABC-type nitrate/sulfonate/bicarbonate transport system substrate-binding protein
MKSSRLHVRTLFVMTVLAAMAAAILGAWSCRANDWSNTETLVIGLPPLEQNALIYVADSQQFFAGNGLNVILRDYDSGVTSLNALLKGDVDMAEAAEYPFVGAALHGENITIIAVNDKFENGYIAARRDRGIGEIVDLKGKKIGVARQTIGEFYLGRFLDLHGITVRDVTITDVPPAQFVSSIAAGDVDAVVVWQPYASRIQRDVKDVVLWPATSSQPAFGILACNNGWLARNASTVQRFLRSLAQAEDFVARYPAQAKAAVQKRLNYETSYIDAIWAGHSFSLSLDFSLISAMNDEARWMMSNNLSSGQAVPDFLYYIYVDGLKAVNLKSVNIAR